MKTYFALTVTALICLAGPVVGQQSSGDTELQLQGRLFFGGSKAKDDSGSADVQIGRFFTDYQEIGVGADVNLQGDGKLGGSAGPYYRYNFSTGHVVPYLEASVGSTFGSFNSQGTTTIATGEGGARFFVDRRTAFTVAATKTYFFKEKEFDKGLTIKFGFSHLWGK